MTDSTPVSIPISHAWRWCVVAGLSLFLLAGCEGQPTLGNLKVHSLGDDPVRLDEAFTTSVYDHDQLGETSFWLSNVSLDELRAGRVNEGLVVHIELLWEPRAGSTPMDSAATNASIRYTIISNGEVGIYVGAGFARVNGSLGAANVSISVLDATIELGDATSGFRDLLTPAELAGDFRAQLDRDRTKRIKAATSQFVTNAFGRTRFVMSDDIGRALSGIR